MSIKQKITRGTLVSGCIFTRYQNFTQAKTKKFIDEQYKQNNNKGLILKSDIGLLFLGTGREMIKTDSRGFVLAEIAKYKRPLPNFELLLETGYTKYYDEITDTFKCLETLLIEKHETEKTL